MFSVILLFGKGAQEEKVNNRKEQKENISKIKIVTFTLFGKEGM